MAISRVGARITAWIRASNKKADLTGFGFRVSKRKTDRIWVHHLQKKTHHLQQKSRVKITSFTKKNMLYSWSIVRGNPHEGLIDMPIINIINTWFVSIL